MVRLRGDGDEGVGEDVTYDASRSRPALGAELRSPASTRSIVLAAARRRRALPRAHRDPRRSASTGAGRSRARRSTSRCGRPAPRSATRSGARPGRCAFVVSTRGRRRSSRRLAALASLRFKLDPTSEWTRRAGRASSRRSAASAAVDLKGALRRHGGRPAARPGALPRACRVFPDAWIEDPALDDETRAVLAAPRPDHLGRAHPLASRTSTRCRSRRGRSTSSRRGSAAARAVRVLRRRAPSGHRRSTAAASSSSAPAAARSRPRLALLRRQAERRGAERLQRPSRAPGLPQSPLPPSQIPHVLGTHA